MHGDANPVVHLSAFQPSFSHSPVPICCAHAATGEPLITPASRFAPAQGLTHRKVAPSAWPTFLEKTSEERSGKKPWQGFSAPRKPFPFRENAQ